MGVVRSPRDRVWREGQRKLAEQPHLEIGRFKKIEIEGKETEGFTRESGELGW